MVKITGENLIAGIGSRQGSIQFTAYNPRSSEPLKIKFTDAEEEEIDKAVLSAVDAFNITRSYPAEMLAVYLDSIAREIEGLGKQLLKVCDMETALGLTRLESERARTCDQFRAFAAFIREGHHFDAIIDTKSSNSRDLRRMQIPVGPVAVFGVSNFPFAFGVCGGDTASAWAAGCPVIAKAHPSHPGTSELFARAVYRAIGSCKFPLGWFSLIQGVSVDVGKTLVLHPNVEAVGFTGSFRGGRAIFDLAAGRTKPIPVYAEMGSLNPVFIMPGAIKLNAEKLAKEIVDSITLGAGQFCTKPGLIFLLNTPESNEFIENIIRLIHDKPTDPLLNDIIVRNLSQAMNHSQKVTQLEVLAGGKADNGEGFRFQYTVLKTNAETFLKEEVLREERFGPVTLIVICDSMNDMVQSIYALMGQLTGTIYAEDSEKTSVLPLIQTLKQYVGRVIWNGVPTGVAVCNAMQHGGPYPATTAPHSTSVGMTAIRRFMRPVTFQNMPENILPAALRSDNPLGILRMINGTYTKDPIK